MRTEQDLPWLQAPLDALRSGPPGHALILHGGAGSGLLELALRLAQSWLCERPPGPCDACPSCHMALAHTHTDLKVLLPETWQQRLNWAGADGEASADSEGDAKSRKKPSKEIKVDAVRQAIDWAHTSSGRGRGKVLVFYPAEAMNQVAANALLKTLEEPGQGMRLLLCVDDPERLLPTIRSRCQRFRLEGPSHGAALAWLKAEGVAQPEQMLMAAGGQPLGALSLVSEGLGAEQWAALPGQVARGDASQLASWGSAQALLAMQQICHDAMCVAAGGSPRYFPPSSMPVTGNWPALVAWSQTLNRASRHDEHPWNAPLLIESMVMQGRLALQADPPEPRVSSRSRSLNSRHE
jgi:DNA polymerase-3 subunit delta'